MRERIDYEHRYRQLVERLPAIVYRASVLDSGDWHYVSPAIDRVLGWTVEEWQAHPAPWGTSVHPDDMAAAIEQEERAVESGSLVSEYRMRHKDGSEVWIRDEAVLVEEDGEPQWHGILTDVTEQRTLEERLHQSHKIEAVGQLAGGIAHDFNNLLVAINGYGELAMSRAGDDTELRHALEQIAFASAKARDLTQRLLSFTRKEARVSVTADLNDVVASAHPMLRRLIGTDVELVTLPAERACFVSVDRTELDQALIAPAVLPAPAPSIDTASVRSDTILLIEDDDSVREVAGRVLTRAGYTVIEARYGSEALDLAAEHPVIDLVLSDVVMPGLSGPEVVLRLRETRPEIVPLFMSGYAPESEGPLGGAELVRKPFTGPELLAAIRRALDSDAAEQHATVVTP